MDESRKAFEQWCKKVMTDDADFCMEWGDYSNLNVRLRWEAWQASRAAIEIELPDELTIEDCIDKNIDVCRATQFNLGMGKLEQAIRAAGIKVKE